MSSLMFQYQGKAREASPSQRQTVQLPLVACELRAVSQHIGWQDEHPG